MNKKIKTEPNSVFCEYRDGNSYKSSIGKRGLYKQTKINERFYVGDQWHGAKCGADKPLVRRNIIKRMADYKMSNIATAPVSVSFSADGIPNNAPIQKEVNAVMNSIADGNVVDFSGEVDNIETNLIMRVLTDYFAVSAERLKFDAKKEQALRNAYISGTGIAYTYWDADIQTGLYVDAEKSSAIKGDIALEILDVENVNFGDPNNCDVQSQPFIIVSQRLNCEDVKREARRNGITTVDDIVPDHAYNLENSGDRGMQEPSNSKRVTVLTKFYKEWNEKGTDYTVKAVKVTEKSYVRKPWDLGIKCYPFAKMCWDTRRSSAYGESEITYLIPNQIAINRALTAEIWSVMTTGMPMMIVNGDTIPNNVSNNPGEIIKVYGSNEDVQGAVRMVQPPAFASQMINAINDLAINTLNDGGANDAALGNVRPDNASAIIQMREAALQPLQIYSNRFYDFIEDIAKIWAEFWLRKYGNRQLPIADGSFVPFDAERYKNIVINARIDVGSSPMYSVPATVATLDGLYANQIINRKQYIERIPQGIIPDLSGLINDIEEEEAMAEQQAMAEQEMSDDSILQGLAEQNPDAYATYQQLSPEQQAQMLAEARGGITDESNGIA